MRKRYVKWNIMSFMKKKKTNYNSPAWKSHAMYCHPLSFVNMYILIVSSQTTRSVGVKLGRNVHWMFVFAKKVCLFVCLFVCLLLNGNAQQNQENHGCRKWRFLFLYMERLVFNYSLFSVCSLYNSLYLVRLLIFHDSCCF